MTMVRRVATGNREFAHTAEQWYRQRHDKAVQVVRLFVTGDAVRCRTLLSGCATCWTLPLRVAMNSRMHVTAALQSMQRQNDGLRYRSPAINTANDHCSHRGIGALEMYTRRRLEILLAISLIEKNVQRMRQNVPAIIVLESREKWKQ